MAVEAAGAVTVRSASGVQIASVPDPERSARAVALSRTRLAIERTFTLDLYNPATGSFGGRHQGRAIAPMGH